MFLRIGFGMIIVTISLDDADRICPPSYNVSLNNEQVCIWLSNTAIVHVDECKHTRAQSVIEGIGERNCRRISINDVLIFGENVCPQ